MARRFGKFNPRQKRDSHGRWTSGGGSSSKASSKKKSSGNDRNKFAKRGAKIGTAAGGLVAAWGTFNPITISAGATTGAAIGAVVGGKIDGVISLHKAKKKQQSLKSTQALKRRK